MYLNHAVNEEIELRFQEVGVVLRTVDERFKNRAGTLGFTLCDTSDNNLREKELGNKYTIRYCKHRESSEAVRKRHHVGFAQEQEQMTTERAQHQVEPDIIIDRGLDKESPYIQMLTVMKRVLKHGFDFRKVGVDFISKEGRYLAENVQGTLLETSIGRLNTLPQSSEQFSPEMTRFVAD